MNEPALPLTAAVLLERIKSSRAELESLVGSLDEQRLTCPGPDGGWAPKDHLTHLAGWERMLLAHLGGAGEHEVVRLSPADFARSSLDELNARIYELHRDETPGNVVREFHAAHRELTCALEVLTADDLRRAYWDDDPGGRCVAEKVAGDTYLHYEEHRRWILELVQGA